MVNSQLFKQRVKEELASSVNNFDHLRKAEKQAAWEKFKMQNAQLKQYEVACELSRNLTQQYKQKQWQQNRTCYFCPRPK